MEESQTKTTNVLRVITSYCRMRAVRPAAVRARRAVRRPDPALAGVARRPRGQQTPQWIVDLNALQ